jgi:hypothetical protein
MIRATTPALFTSFQCFAEAAKKVEELLDKLTMWL